MLYQQGDVLFHSETEVPNDAKTVKAQAGRLIVAEGEATGHAHAIAATPDVNLFERDGVLFLDCATDAAVTHEEHKPVTLPPGKYRIGIVQEYDHFAEEARRVQD